MSTYTTASYFASELVFLVMVAFNAQIRCAISEANGTSCNSWPSKAAHQAPARQCTAFATLLAPTSSNTRKAHGAGTSCLWQFWQSIQRFTPFTQVEVA